MKTAAAEDDVTVRIPRSALTVVAPLPFSVTQKTSEALFGLPPKAFLALARSGKFPVTAVGSLRVAICEDVRAYLETSAKIRTRRGRKGPEVEDDFFAGLAPAKGGG